jgi:DNA-binding response OmpR family regulator
MPKILLIEDDALLIRMYKKKLELDGYNVTTANNGEEGLSKFKKEDPDLVLLDVMMPKMNGFEVLENVKADEQLKKIPVILLTNLGSDDEDIERGLELGAAAYLIKSYSTS